MPALQSHLKFKQAATYIYAERECFARAHGSLMNRHFDRKITFSPRLYNIAIITRRQKPVGVSEYVSHKQTHTLSAYERRKAITSIAQFAAVSSRNETDLIVNSAMC